VALGWWSLVTRRRAQERWRRKRRAVSPVIAELLLIVMTVAIGTLVYSFASSAFGGFGTGFSNLVQGAGQQLSENIAIEQVYFFNSVANNTGCASFNPGPTHCGGVLYVRNVGNDPVLIDAIYMGNVTQPNSPTILTLAPPPPTCSSNTLTPAIVATAQAGQVCFFTFAAGPTYDNNLIPMTAANEIAPGQVALIHFMLPDSSYCAIATPLNCTVAFGGTTYAFTLVTSRGNNFVAYETA